jgi:osomolarity two-component system, sensor histidine kinase SLN1
MVLGIAVWFQNYSFITTIRLSGLSLTASLKAAQVSSTLLLYQSQCLAMTTRVLIQSALGRYNQGTFSSYNISTLYVSPLANAGASKGNQTNQNWIRPQSDLTGALGNGDLLVQAALYPAFDPANQTAINGLLNVTAEGLNGTAVKLPYNYPNGSAVYLGNDEFGYPPTLYPNLTYSANTSAASADAFFQGQRLDPHDMLLLGPLSINDSYSLISATIGIINNTSRTTVLGWLTVVLDASMLFDIQDSPEGLGKTGEVLLVGPATTNNRFESDPRAASAMAVENRDVRFILPPKNDQNRHTARSTSDTTMIPFEMGSFPAVVSAWTKKNGGPNNAGAYISTQNEDGLTISAGYSTLSTPFVDWVLLVEQSKGEVVAPIHHLRDVVLICVFSVMGALLILIFPLAHYAIAPIRQLRAATKKTVEPYQPDEASQYSSSNRGAEAGEEEHISNMEEARKEGFLDLAKWTGTRGRSAHSLRSPRRGTFRIPSKVPERKHFITDELTDLTSTFNEMVDELSLQYERLEERVREEGCRVCQPKQDIVHCQHLARTQNSSERNSWPDYSLHGRRRHHQSSVYLEHNLQIWRPSPPPAHRLTHF